MRDRLSRWTSSGTANGSVWNGSISSRVNARPFSTVLVQFHMEPFPCKRGLKMEVFNLFGTTYRLLVLRFHFLGMPLYTSIKSFPFYGFTYTKVWFFLWVLVHNIKVLGYHTKLGFCSCKCLLAISNIIASYVPLSILALVGKVYD